MSQGSWPISQTAEFFYMKKGPSTSRALGDGVPSNQISPPFPYYSLLVRLISNGKTAASSNASGLNCCAACCWYYGHCYWYCTGCWLFGLAYCACPGLAAAWNQQTLPRLQLICFRVSLIVNQSETQACTFPGSTRLQPDGVYLHLVWLLISSHTDRNNAYYYARLTVFFEK